ncbi:MAG: class I SAM-dependent methyltransferase [Candidatus Lokiarchaeota archaeon]|nr:class I SAM-dependent methyltransferase [Candidatus Lokiarchaeota archaeon]
MKEDNEDYFYINGQHYDNMIKSRNAYESVPFYVKHAKKYGGPILELACGTGRITIPITKEGLSIVGLDYSVKMLEQAKRNSSENNVEIEWIEADMTNFNLSRKFSVIIIPAAAMNWVLEDEDIEKCLTCIKDHLNQDGRLIFNVFNPNLDILMRDPSKKYDIDKYPDPDGKGTVVVTVSNYYDKATQINNVSSYSSIKNKEIVKKLKLRMFFPQELDALLYYNGFIIDHKYGTFDEEPFNSDSNWQIVICHKK